MSSPPDGSERGPFWSVFERSHIPMVLVDRDRRYVAVNDAAVDFYRVPRDQVIGRRAGTGMPNEDPSILDPSWDELLRTGELYDERVVRGSGPAMRVSFAAHETSVDREWHALVVVLSAHIEPEGDELIGSIAPTATDSGEAETGRAGRGANSPAKRLTRREREIVQRVALGRSTPQIAVDLSVSPATVRSHVRNAMVKTGSHTRAQLVALVLGDGLASE
jgi:DNA-binding CsgD family transcriptional regulator